MRSGIWVKILGIIILGSVFGLVQCSADKVMVKSKDVFGKAELPAICYSGYRKFDRNPESEPTVEEIKEDLLLLHALGFRLLRTYQTYQFPHAANLLKAIADLKKDNPSFEMYVMLGAWIQCEAAWTDNPNHERGDEKFNRAEIDTAVSLAKRYPETVAAIAVGNESMVHWAQSYHVSPAVVLKWVNYLQELKNIGDLSKDLWITSSDNFASWGGGDPVYHKPDLEELIRQVDFLSVHTYPFHDTHYHSEYWLGSLDSTLSKEEQCQKSMKAAADYARNQYSQVANYIKSLGVDKPIHIGETGWSTNSVGFYGRNGSKAADEYKQKLYYDDLMAWSANEGVSCFFFEAFDEPWKDTSDVNASENHFGLFTVEGQAKMVIWDQVEKNLFKEMKRGDNTITKTYEGDTERLLSQVELPSPQIANHGE